jgi:5'-nucleotidase
MKILITNDDGILAKGIETLYRAVADLGEVEVVAPETTQSAMGHAITIRSPLIAHRMHVNNSFHGWSVDGRPADCVKLALCELLGYRPDFILSGINHGANTGINVLYSGTVAGAAEGAFFGIPSIAYSLELSDNLDFEKARWIARDVFLRFVRSQPRPGTCLNVNIPALDDGWPVGVKVVPMGLMTMEDEYKKHQDERGRTVYWLDGKFPDHSKHPDSDLAALRERYVTVTPLRFELTHLEMMATLREWSWPSRFGEEV